MSILDFGRSTGFAAHAPFTVELGIPGSAEVAPPTVTPELEYFGTNDKDVFLSLGGDTIAYGFHGDDVLIGAEGTDIFFGGKDEDVLFGMEGEDWLDGGNGDDLLDGGEQADVLIGGDGNDTMDGGRGSDRLHGDGGRDELDGGDGDDTLDGGGGRDRLDGGDGADVLCGGADSDTLTGGNGHDILEGGTDADVLDGGAGDDLLIAYSFAGEPRVAQDPEAKVYPDEPLNDTDYLTGGEGADTFLFRWLIDARPEMLESHRDPATGRIDYTETGVAGENGSAHAHWTECMGTKVVTDFDAAAGDVLIFEGHDVALQEARHEDWNGDGIIDTMLRFTSGSSLTNTGFDAHFGDYLGKVIVLGQTIDTVAVDGSVYYGVEDTYIEPDWDMVG